jgi:hypothetical protein
MNIDFGQAAVGGIAIIPLVVGLVQVIKKAGLSGNKLMLIAMAIGMVAGLLWRLSIMFPVAGPWIELIFYVIAFGLFALASTGLYDLGNLWTGRLKG